MAGQERRMGTAQYSGRHPAGQPVRDSSGLHQDGYGRDDAAAPLSRAQAALHWKNGATILRSSIWWLGPAWLSDFSGAMIALSAVIVDDEELARDELAYLLKNAD